MSADFGKGGVGWNWAGGDEWSFSGFGDRDGTKAFEMFILSIVFRPSGIIYVWNLRLGRKGLELDVQLLLLLLGKRVKLEDNK